MTNNTNDLFGDFDPTSTDDWHDAIIKSLKGKDYNETLLWETENGFNINPFYRKEDITNIEKSSYKRNPQKTSNHWWIRNIVSGTSSDELIKKINQLIDSGATSIEIKGNDDFDTLSAVVNHFRNSAIEIGFSTKGISEAHIAKLEGWGFLNFDPIGDAITTGNAIKDIKLSPSDWKLLNISGDIYHEAGGSTVQELALTLAHGVEYLNRYSEVITPQNIQFTFSIGSNYFFEIAKIRAFRVLWANVLKQYYPNTENLESTIHCQTSRWNTTIYDAHNNILRATTESMAAVIGGCDSLTVLPYDLNYNENNEKSERIARNIQIILEKESYFSKVVDPAGGSYYVEHLTDQLCQKSWELFKEIEEKGGLMEGLKNSEISKMLSNASDVKKNEIKKGERVILGVNKFPNDRERMSNRIKVDSTLSENSDSSLIHSWRAVEEMEKERLRDEKN